MAPSLLFLPSNAACLCLVAFLPVASSFSLAIGRRLVELNPNAVSVTCCSPTLPRTSHQRKVRASSPVFLGKWDNLIDEDEDDLEMGEELPGPRDMRYIEYNIGRQNRNFVDIRTAGGPELTNDIYARKAGDDAFYFAGKVARVSDVPPEVAVARQWSLIETHAARLRPIELYPSKGKLELWLAPGDSEMDVAYNRPNVQFVQMKRPEDVEGVDDVKVACVGFQGEMYEVGEEGFRTWRNDDGSPAKPEITETPEKGEKRAPTDAEFADIQAMMQGKDLNELFDK